MGGRNLVAWLIRPRARGLRREHARGRAHHRPRGAQPLLDRNITGGCPGRRPCPYSCAVGGHSPALWLRGGDTAPGAFDDAADFARHDVIRVARSQGRAAWGGAALWLDGGADDPFRPGGESLARALGVRMHHWPGGHDGAYWHAHYGAYLHFYARALARC
jgi:hypothetical protein